MVCWLHLTSWNLQEKSVEMFVLLKPGSLNTVLPLPLLLPLVAVSSLLAGRGPWDEQTKLRALPSDRLHWQAGFSALWSA